MGEVIGISMGHLGHCSSLFRKQKHQITKTTLKFS